MVIPAAIRSTVLFIFVSILGLSSFIQPSSALAQSLKPLNIQSLSATTTPISFLIEYFQKKYADQNKTYPILIVNRDELYWQFAKAGVLDASTAIGKSKRIEILKNWVLEKLKITLTADELVNLETYFSERKEGAYGVPIFDQINDRRKHRACLVFPADVNSNERFETERVLGLAIPGAYENVGFDQLTSRMTYGELRLFSLAHELGHCFDLEYLPQTDAAYENVHNTHLSESFAETFSALLLAKEGYSQLTQRRGHLRSIYARKIGELFGKNPDLSRGDINAMYYGAIYYLSPVLSGAQLEIDGNSKSFPSQWSLWDVVSIAQKVVQKFALKYLSFAAIGSANSQGREPALAMYKRFAEETPETFAEPYKFLLDYFKNTDQSLESSFDPHAKAPKPTETLSGIDHSRFCGLFKTGTRVLLQAEIEKLRRELISAQASAEQQKERSNQLKQLLKNLQDSCP